MLRFNWLSRSGDGLYAKLNVAFHVTCDELVLATTYLLEAGESVDSITRSIVETEIRNTFRSSGDSDNWPSVEEPSLAREAEQIAARLFPEAFETLAQLAGQEPAS